MDPNPLEIGQTLLTLGAIAALYAKMRSTVRDMAGKGEAREITNNPLRTEEASPQATLRDVERVERRVVHLESEVREMKRNTDQFREKLHEELTDIRDRMSDQFQVQGETLRSIERSVGRLEGH